MIGYSKSSKTLTIDLQHIISTYPGLEIWDLLNLQHILIHYEGVGILPNVFPRYIDKSIIETLLPIYYTGSTNLFTLGLSVFTQADPINPVPKASNSVYYTATYTLTLVKSAYYNGAIPADFTPRVVKNPATLEISQPVLDFYSPGVYELKAVFQDNSSPCHKITRKYNFELSHILTSFVVDMAYTFTMGESLIININTITPMLPTLAMKRVFLILCKPLAPNNLITDLLSCNPISVFPGNTQAFVNFD